MILVFYVIDYADRWLFSQIYFHWHNSLLDAVVPFFSDPFAHYKLFLLGLAVVLMFVCERRMRLTIIFMLLAVGVADLISSRILKELYCLTRPMSFLGEAARGYSFPSSHAANTWAAISLFQRDNPRFRPLLWALGFLVCFSRVYVGDHYPGDVIAGGFLGIGIGWNVYRLQRPVEHAWDLLWNRYRFRIAQRHSKKD